MYTLLFQKGDNCTLLDSFIKQENAIKELLNEADFYTQNLLMEDKATITIRYSDGESDLLSKSEFTQIPEPAGVDEIELSETYSIVETTQKKKDFSQKGDAFLRSVKIDSEFFGTATYKIVPTEISDKNSDKEKWVLGIEQEFPKSTWGALIGAIHNSKGTKEDALFYVVGKEGTRYSSVKVFSTINLDEDSYLFSFPYNANNFDLLLERLNSRPFEEIKEDWTLISGLPYDIE